jgi:hypothetical protein
MDFVATDLIARSALSRPSAGRAALAGTRNSTRRWSKNQKQEIEEENEYSPHYEMERGVE